MGLTDLMLDELSPQEMGEVLLGLPGRIEPELEHFHAPGLYARKITLPAGSLAVGKKHKTTHISVLAKGHIAVRGVNGKPDHHMRAGDTMVTPAGSQRAVYAFEESVFVCIHATDETDLEKLEAQLIEAPMLEGPP
jgi:quercetin dioxygenase-like cupin family protein